MPAWRLDRRRAFNASIVSFLLGVGVGAIAQVVVQLAPRMRDDRGRYIHPLSAAGCSPASSSCT